MSESSDEQVYGFGKADTELILDMLPGVGSQSTPGQANRQVRDFWMKTKAGGIPANGKAFCFYREPTDTGWADTTTEYEVWNQHPTAAVGGTKIILVGWVNGRLCCKMELC
jgi:hypothetical protein